MIPRRYFRIERIRSGSERDEKGKFDSCPTGFSSLNSERISDRVTLQLAPQISGMNLVKAPNISWGLDTPMSRAASSMLRSVDRFTQHHLFGVGAGGNVYRTYSGYNQNSLLIIVSGITWMRL